MSNISIFGAIGGMFGRRFEKRANRGIIEFARADEKDDVSVLFLDSKRGSCETLAN